MRLTLRDEKILAELSCNICSLGQIADAFFSSRKKACERMKKLFDAGLVKRVPCPFVAGGGKAEFIYSARPIRDVYTVPHSLMISDVRFAFLLSSMSEFKSEFYYPKQLGLKQASLCGLIPDGVIVIEGSVSGKKIVHFLEADCGSETLSSKKSSYSLEYKLEKYLMLFDDKEAMKCVGEVFGFEVRGFRVLVVGKGERRMDGIKRLAGKLGAEFVWCALHEDMKRQMIYSSVWNNCKFEALSLIKPYPTSAEGGEIGRD